MLKAFRTTILMVYFLAAVAVLAGDDSETKLGSGSSLCASLLGDPDLIPTMDDFLHPKPGFVHNTGDYKYQGKLGCALDIRNQGAFGSCWAQSELRAFELRELRATGHHTPLSADFMMAIHLIENGVLAIFHPEYEFEEGGEAGRVAELGQRFGFVPEDVWTSRLPLARSRSIIRKLVFQLLVIVHNARAAYSLIDEDDWRAQIDFLEMKREELRSCVEAFTGPLPEEFQFEGQILTPPMLFNLPRYQAPERTLVAAKEAGAMALFRKIQAQLDKSREPVITGIHWEPVFIDSFTGVASLEAFYQHPVKSPEMRRAVAGLAAKASGPDGGAHSLLIIDYVLDASGMPVKLLAMNSHGSHQGDGGYLHIYWDYFETFAIDAYLLDHL